MPSPLLLSLLVTPTVKWLHRVGGPGLILLGIADNSLIPMPGSMDVLTIWLSAHQRAWWPYFAAMATLGALIGGYITYSLARKGGKEALERRLSKKTAAKVYERFERWGFWTVTVSAVLPPPFPIVPFLLAAGAMQYPRKKFLGALALGRGVRFTIIALLGVIYGRHIVRFFSQYYEPALLTLIALSLITGSVALIQYFRFRKRNSVTGTGGIPRPNVA